MMAVIMFYSAQALKEVNLSTYNEADHPRAPKGNETGGEWTRLIANPAPPASIQQFRDDHWDSTKEYSIILQNGKPIRTVGGNKKYSIEYSDEERELLRNGSMIHNHPRASALSDSDIILASNANLESIEAFGLDPYTKEKISWVIERPAEGWPPRDKIKRAFKIYENAYVIRARAKMKTDGWDSNMAAHWATNEIMARTVENLKLRMVRNVYP